jgi:hypothetical protein
MFFSPGLEQMRGEIARQLVSAIELVSTGKSFKQLFICRFGTHNGNAQCEW